LVCYIRKYVIILGDIPVDVPPTKILGDVSPASPAGLTPVEKQFTIYVKCSCRSGRQADSVDTLVTGSSSCAVLQTRLTRTGDRLNWAHYDVCGTTSLRRRRCRCQPTAHCNKYHVTPQMPEKLRLRRSLRPALQHPIH